MVGKKISKRSAFSYSALSVLLLIAAYTVMSHLQHRKNANDRTVPTWN